MSTCHFCSAPNARLNANHWTGSEYIRVDLCGWPATCADKLAKAPRKPRVKRQPRALYGDFAMLAQFHGIATDGTGRKVR